ncbi:MAG: AraC family transcriptional regulator [Paenibacillus sp.]|nr:AraC family transcriptional regulator [Paenibacillus sp.]
MSVSNRDERAAHSFIPSFLDIQVELGAIRFSIHLNPGFFREICPLPVMSHSHTNYEVQLVHRGSMALSMDNGYQIVQAGRCCFIPPGLYHSQLEAPAGEDVHKTSFQFSFEAMPGEKPVFDSASPRQETDLLLRAFTEAPFFIARENTTLPALVETIKQELQARHIGYYAKVQSLFAQLLVELIRSSPRHDTSARYEPPQASFGNRVTLIENFFNERYSTPLKEEELASLLYVSKRQLNRILHELYGISFRTKLLHTRIQVAMDLLKTSNMTVKDIAAFVGYPLAENFHASFKTVTNMTPTAFRSYSRLPDSTER